MYLAANPFDTITGLPVHPLVVHAAVVLYPLGILGLLAVLLVPRLRRHYGWPSIVALAVGAIFVFVAKESGEALAHRIGEPKDHAQWGDIATVVAFFTTVVSLAWWLLDRIHARRAARPERLAATRDGAYRGERDGATVAAAPKRSALTRVLGILAGVLGVAGLVTMVLVGHSGATAVWADQMGSSSTAPAPAATPSATPTGAASSAPAAAATSAAPGTYTMAEVAKHNNAQSCWAAVKAPGESTTGVYDLTKWIAAHPGGPEPIQGMCGTDGTQAFTAKHGEDGPNGDPEKQLATLKIGTLAG